MKKQIALVMMLALVASLFTASAFAQMTGQVRGKAIDEQGKPIVGATVLYESVETGRKVTGIKTDKKGEYYAMGVNPGRYKITLIGADGKPIWALNNIQVSLAKENIIDFDMAKERAAAAKAGGMSEEERKQIEAAQKENQKIKGLNAMLTQAADLRKAGNCDEAINVMQQAVQADATKDLLWFSLGESQLCAKKYPEAIESYKKAIAIAPNHGEYFNNLGQAYLRNNQTEDAIASYDKAAQLDPANAAMYYFNEGAVLTNKGKTEEAAVAFDKALAADPNKADAYYWKGVNLLAKAKVASDGSMTAPEGTAEAFNKYLELQPTGQYAEASKQMLATIGAKVETSYGKAKGKKK